MQLDQCDPVDINSTNQHLKVREKTMSYPEFITAFPSLDVPFPEDVVQSSVIRSDSGLVAFFSFLKDMELPAHSHGAQWGTVVEGEIELTIGGETKTYRAGDSYSIPAGVEHGGLIKAGTRVIDVFAEADRYPIKT
jgi:quercetin dioxygenase-like cupin family protein